MIVSNDGDDLDPQNSNLMILKSNNPIPQGKEKCLVSSPQVCGEIDQFLF